MLALLLLAAPARAAERWPEFELLMWQDHSAEQIAGLARMGFTGTKLIASGGRIDPAALATRRASGLPYYLENIGTDFYAPYHRYTPGRGVTWLFDAAKARRRADPGDAGVFVREPGLSDPAWLAAIQTRLADMVRIYGPDRPLFYNLADESGIGDLAAAWDADIAPTSLDGMRAWLQTQYADLDALNRQWGTAYADWTAVQPELTDAAMARTDDNYSAWSDFKAWMDLAFAAAVRAGTNALHRADPAALSAIEGAQVPGWGGYDYGRLAGAVDAMEIYDAGNALDLARGLNPGLITLRTSFETGPREAHATWRFLLRGGRGLIVWDEADTVVAANGSPGPRGRELSALVREMRTVAPALFASRPHADPVAVLHSQESFRVRWMLDHRPKGAAWSDRDAEREYDDNAWRAARRQTAGRLAELGVAPRWLSSDGVEAGALRDPALRVLILPHAIALSDREVQEIRRFAARGGAVLADTEPGVFDGHGRRRTALPLVGVASLPQPLRPDAEPSSPAFLSALGAMLAASGAGPDLRLTGPDGAVAAGVDMQRFHTGGVTILALQPISPWGSPGHVTLRLPEATFIYDMRVPGPPRQANEVALTLDPVLPTILALSPSPLPAPVLSGVVHSGGQVTVRASLSGPGPADAAALRVALVAPDGTEARSGIVSAAAPVSWDATLPTGAVGRWTVRATDPLSGQSTTVPLPMP